MTDPKIMHIAGGKRLSGGAIDIAGSSNQVTKCIIASLLTDEKVLIKGAPHVDERLIVERLYASMGGEVETLDNDTIRLSSQHVAQPTIAAEQCRRNRIAILCAGPLLHRFGEVSFGGPLGGDRIGRRPVDFHLSGLEAMGAEVEVDSETGAFRLSVGKEGLRGAKIRLPFPSVMTTENLIMAAVKARGRTIIENAAIEPEIIELIKMLQKMGADISLDSARTFVIKGVKSLRGCELRCMFDRNQAVSFAVAALATGGDVLLRNVNHDSVFSFINFIQRMGARFTVSSSGLYVEAPQPLQGTHVEVEVHPGFMTDWQQPFMVLFTQAHGISVLHETVFEERLSYAEYLRKMGAEIYLTDKCLGDVACRYKHHNFTHAAIIKGPTRLHGGDFQLPTDIRAGKCLVVAGLVAEGITTLSNIHELERKYDNLVPKLVEMGAEIELRSA